MSEDDDDSEQHHNHSNGFLKNLLPPPSVWQERQKRGRNAEGHENVFRAPEFTGSRSVSPPSKKPRLDTSASKSKFLICRTVAIEFSGGPSDHEHKCYGCPVDQQRSVEHCGTIFHGISYKQCCPNLNPPIQQSSVLCGQTVSSDHPRSPGTAALADTSIMFHGLHTLDVDTHCMSLPEQLDSKNMDQVSERELNQPVHNNVRKIMVLKKGRIGEYQRAKTGGLLRNQVTFTAKRRRRNKGKWQLKKENVTKSSLLRHPTDSLPITSDLVDVPVDGGTNKAEYISVKPPVSATALPVQSKAFPPLQSFSNLDSKGSSVESHEFVITHESTPQDRLDNLNSNKERVCEIVKDMEAPDADSSIFSRVVAPKCFPDVLDLSIKNESDMLDPPFKNLSDVLDPPIKNLPDLLDPPFKILPDVLGSPIKNLPDVLGPLIKNLPDVLGPPIKNLPDPEPPPTRSLLVTRKEPACLKNRNVATPAVHCYQPYKGNEEHLASSISSLSGCQTDSSTPNVPVLVSHLLRGDGFQDISVKGVPTEGIFSLTDGTISVKEAASLIGSEQLDVHKARRPTASKQTATIEDKPTYCHLAECYNDILKTDIFPTPAPSHSEKPSFVKRSSHSSHTFALNNESLATGSKCKNICEDQGLLEFSGNPNEDVDNNKRSRLQEDTKCTSSTSKALGPTCKIKNSGNRSTLKETTILSADRNELLPQLNLHNQKHYVMELPGNNIFEMVNQVIGQPNSQLNEKNVSDRDCIQLSKRKRPRTPKSTTNVGNHFAKTKRLKDKIIGRENKEGGNDHYIESRKRESMSNYATLNEKISKREVRQARHDNCTVENTPNEDFDEAKPNVSLIHEQLKGRGNRSASSQNNCMTKIESHDKHQEMNFQNGRDRAKYMSDSGIERKLLRKKSESSRTTIAIGSTCSGFRKFSTEDGLDKYSAKINVTSPSTQKDEDNARRLKNSKPKVSYLDKYLEVRVPVKYDRLRAQYKWRPCRIVRPSYCLYVSRTNSTIAPSEPSQAQQNFENDSLWKKVETHIPQNMKPSVYLSNEIKDLASRQSVQTAINHSQNQEKDAFLTSAKEIQGSNPLLSGQNIVNSNQNQEKGCFSIASNGMKDLVPPVLRKIAINNQNQEEGSFSISSSFPLTASSSLANTVETIEKSWQRGRKNHWQLVEDYIDVSGYDEELQLPSALARDMRSLQDLVNGVGPPLYARYTEAYAKMRDHALVTRSAWFFPTNKDILELEYFNIYQMHEELTATGNIAKVALFPERSTTFDKISNNDFKSSKISSENGSSRDMQPQCNDNYSTTLHGTPMRQHRKSSNSLSERTSGAQDEESREVEFSQPKLLGASSQVLLERRNGASLQNEGNHIDGGYNIENKAHSPQKKPFVLSHVIFGLLKPLDTQSDGFNLWGTPIKEGDMIRVLFPTDTSHRYLDEEEFQYFKLTTLTHTLQKIVGFMPKLSNIHLAHYAPNIFWNLVFRFECDQGAILRFIHPNLPNHRSLRGCRHTLAVNPLLYRRPEKRSNGLTTKVRKESDPSSTSGSELLISQPEPEIASALRRSQVFEHLKKTAEERVRLFELCERRDPNERSPTNSEDEWEKWLDDGDLGCISLELISRKRRERRERRITNTKDPLRVLESYIDFDGFPKVSLANVSLAHRQIIYGYCCIHGWTAPLEIRMNEKGRAVYAAKDLSRHDFICEYTGDFIRGNIARFRERLYETQHKGSYMFYFPNPYNGSICCKDATEEDERYGCARLINHSRKRPNCIAMSVRDPDVQLHSTTAEPRLVFIAKRIISRGEELLIDYGETNPAVLRANPWLEDT